MKYGSITTNEEGESKLLTNAGIPKTGESRIMKKKHRVILVTLAMVTIGFMMGHFTNNSTDDTASDIEMNNKWSEAAVPEFMVDQLVDSKKKPDCRRKGNDCEENGSCCALNEGDHDDLCCGPRAGDGRKVCLIGARSTTTKYCEACRRKGQDCQRNSDCCDLDEGDHDDLCCAPRPEDGRYVCLDFSEGGGRSEGWYCKNFCTPNGGSTTWELYKHYCCCGEAVDCFDLGEFRCGTMTMSDLCD